MRFLVLTLMIMMSWPVQANTSCHGQVLSLVRKIPEAARVFHLGGKSDFFQWIDCSGTPNEDILSATHESTHGIRSTKNVLLTADGRKYTPPSDEGLRLPGDLVFPHFSHIKNSDYVQLYMNRKHPAPGASSLAYSYMLDEFNAYTYDVIVGNSLVSLGSHPSSFYRDGLAAFMSFVAVYAHEAQRKDVETWQRIKNDPLLKSIWSNAEAGMAKSCKIEGIAYESASFLRVLCKNRSGMEEIMGRPISCYSECSP